MRIQRVCTTLPLIAALLAGCASSHQATNTTQPASTTKTNHGDDDKKDGPKAFKDVIKDDFEKDEGIFTIYKDDNTYYYEIPDAQMGKEFLLVTRIAKTAHNLGYGGQKANTQVVRWVRIGDKMHLRVVGHEIMAEEGDPIYQAVQNSSIEPIVKAFDIAAINEDTTGVVIDVTSLFTTDVAALGLPSFRRSSLQVRRLDSDRSYVMSAKSFPENVEVRHVLTYEASSPPSNSSTNTVTVEMAQSMVLLPADPMQPRLCDDRVGLFSVTFTEYSSDQQKATEKCFVTRWRLEPKDPAAYARGELVQPVKPIVYYIDSSTPEKWRGPLKQGVEDWQKAFEAAGFKNAIIARDAPTDDPDFSPEDARYSVIRYFASDVQNASGPNVHDPRTGEILESDINWYHNVMNLLRNWYFVQTAAVNPGARGVEFEEQVMGQLLRFVATHEVGHTLGFQHNMGSSFAYSVEQLRDPVFTSTHGTAPSIMDYARFNYVAQPGDGVTQFMPNMGTYDNYAADWTYRWFAGNMTPKQEFDRLNDLVKSHGGDFEYWWGRSGTDPRAQTEDLTNNAMEASRLGILNLQRILDGLVGWIEGTGRDYDELEELYTNVYGQYNRYIGHVSSNVGGVYETFKTMDQDGPVYEYIPEARQKAAVQWMSDQVLTTPDWLIREDILNRIEGVGTVNRMRSIMVGGVNRLLDPQKMARMLEAEAILGDDTYTVSELFDDVRGAVFSELSSGDAVDGFRRNLQRGYVDRLEMLMSMPDFNATGFRADQGYASYVTSQSDIMAFARNELHTVQTMVDRAAGRTRDSMTRIHLQDLSARIDRILDEDD